MGGVGTRDTGPYIYISIASKLFSEFQIPVEIGLTDGIASPAAQSSQLQVPVGNWNILASTYMDWILMRKEFLSILKI